VAIDLSRISLISDLIGKSLSLTSVFCSVCTLFELLFSWWLLFVVCVYVLVKYWESLFLCRRGLLFYEKLSIEVNAHRP